MKKFLSILICLLISNSNIFAKNLNQTPAQELVPGGVAVINLPSDTTKAFYNNKQVFLLDNVSYKTAIIGIPLSLENSFKNKSKLEQQITYFNKNQKNTKNFFITLINYPTSRITIKNQQMVKPNNKNLNKIINDQKIIKNRYNAFNIYENINLKNITFESPVKGKKSSSFGSRRIINNIKKNPHKGMDIAAPIGAPIYSPLEGKVILAKNLYLPGNTVIIDHGKGLKTLYAHLDKIYIKENQFVKQNTKIGTVGKTGRVTGPHLHWSVILNGEAVNPKLFID